MNWRRVAIVGTAQSWIQTPFTDPGLTICSLNDAYQLQGFGRADVWYDLHPLNKFYHPPQGGRIFAHQVPPGYYVRPAKHLDWLGSRAIPVFLSRAEDHTPPEAYDFPTWPHARPFPKRAIEAEFGRYFTSSPAWMIAHAVMQGCTELHIYGIHLATEHEYIEQRPNFEFLIGRVLGTGKQELTIANGLRTYATGHGRVVLPVESPILASDFQYAFQARPRAHLEPLRWDAHKAGIKRERIIDAFKRKPAWSRKLRFQLPPDTPDGPPTWVSMSTKAAQDELWHLDALAGDVQEQLARVANPWRA